MAERRRPVLSDHFDGRRFFNPDARTDRTFSEFLQWQRASRRTRWPKRVENARFDPPPDPKAGEIAATFIGHSTWLARLPGLSFLPDPILSAPRARAAVPEGGGDRRGLQRPFALAGPPSRPFLPPRSDLLGRRRPARAHRP